MKILLLSMAFLPGMASLSAQDKLEADQKAFILSRFCTEVKYNFVHYNDLKFE